MKISKVLARTVSVPLQTNIAISHRAISQRNYTLVRVECTDGSSGIGFCYSGSYAGGIASAGVREALAPLLAGEDPNAVERLWDLMWSSSLLHGRTGSVMRALSAIDIALWDRNSRAAGLPLWRMLGGYRDVDVPAYASGGYYSPGKTPTDLGDELRGYVAAGFKAVKIKVGAVGLAEDRERVAAAREAVGPGVRLMLDANNAWSNVPDALEAMAAFEPHAPFWIEEPFQPDDVESHAKLSRAIRTPVATGEIEAGRRRFEALLANQAATILQPDAAVCGGVTEFLRIGANAASHSVEVWPHWFHDLHQHLVAALPNAGSVEYFPDASVLNFRQLVDRQVSLNDGRIVLPSTPGLGFGFDADAVEDFGVDDWS